ncbi:hypothetical protein [Methylacidimicrobium sp. B4]|uniref:hypothetical protein n=1 Tax=Methylacidimicrobium sp. B4 TaxID=2796139 RepID=UPI001A8E67BB|nr:hypothetical protein [Methylacidimicrobium sp. B4]QSR84577.1 hypothetical protein MacB4_10330 [Methylacidimicrobium sp. B4]
MPALMLLAVPFLVIGLDYWAFVDPAHAERWQAALAALPSTVCRATGSRVAADIVSLLAVTAVLIAAWWLREKLVALLLGFDESLRSRLRESSRRGHG